MLCFVQAVTAQDVNIPDANFKAALVQNLDINTNGDEEIQVVEAEAFTGDLNIGARDIYDLTGIEAFTGISSLNCNNNSLSNLDISANISLQSLSCSSNLLTSLNVSANPALYSLVCVSNKLTGLDVSSNMNLETLACDDNQINSLNVSANPLLNYLGCGINQLTNLDVSGNPLLTVLYCNNNQLTNLNLSANTALTNLICSTNQLSALDVSTNTALEYLTCRNNLLSNLDVSTNTILSQVLCNYNQLLSLNIKNGNNIDIIFFDATNNSSLTCILVDDPTYMNTNWSSAKDATASYSTSCGCTPPTITTDPAITTDLCPGAPVKLTASAASSYLWSTGATKKSITKKKAGSYTVTTNDVITGCTATSVPVIVTYQTCTTPANISTSVITGTSATFNFTGNACAEKYVIEYHPKGTLTWIVIDSVYASPYTIYGLSPGIKYEYRMRTICSTSPLRQSIYSAKSTFTTSPSFMQNQSLINKSQINSSFNISLSPNPASTNVKLQISGNKTDIAITITDMLGKVVWQLSHVTAQQINLPVENFAKGVYLVVVNNGKEIKQLKLVKE